jgi:hypothetical protein
MVESHGLSFLNSYMKPIGVEPVEEETQELED